MNKDLQFGIFYDSFSANTTHGDAEFGSIIDEASFARMGSRSFVGSSYAPARARALWIITIMVLLILLLRIFHLQIVAGESYAIASSRNRERVVPIVSERGLFFDARGRQLTENEPNFSLSIRPQDVPTDLQERIKIIKRLVSITGDTSEYLSALFQEYSTYKYESIIIRDYIDYETALRLQIETADIPGLFVNRGYKRAYGYVDEMGKMTPLPNSMSHVIGYLSKLSKPDLDAVYEKGYYPSDNIGKIGTEQSYEDILRGTYGKRRVEVDAKGREQSIVAEQAPIPGLHVRLTIDAKMQEELQRIMLKNMEQQDTRRGAAVVMNPKTGGILALISLPAFDNNEFSGGITQDQYNIYADDENRPLFNRAISGTYPSGSTIKPAIATAALEEGIITPRTTVLSTGGIRVGDWFFPDWQSGGHGITDVRKSLAQSVNTFYYFIGGGYQNFEGLGIDRLRTYLQRFGFSQELGVDISGEAEGFIPSKQWKEDTKGERWYIGDTYNMSIGQGDLLVTPLQIASMTATVANGGTVLKPHLVGAIIDPATGHEENTKPVIIRSEVATSSHLETVRLGMRDCVVYGSCVRLSLLPFAAAGKTGTAQWSSIHDPHAWFTSFAPFDDPEIVVTILIEEGKEGSGVASPIAYEFYRWWWQYRNSLP